MLHFSLTATLVCLVFFNNADSGFYPGGVACNGGTVTKEYVQEILRQRVICTVINGSLTFKDVQYNDQSYLNVFAYVQEIRGSLTIQHCFFYDLWFLRGLRSINAIGVKGAPLNIFDNPILQSLGLRSLVEIKGGDEPIKIKNRFELADLHHIQTIYVGKVQFELDDTCKGGRMNVSYISFLYEEKTCVKIDGDVVIENFKEMPRNIAAFEPVEEIRGALIFENNTGFDSLEFLRNLKRISAWNTRGPPLKIVNNRGLFGIGLKKLVSVRNSYRKAILIRNRLPLEESDLQIIRKAYKDGAVDYRQIGAEAKEYHDNTALGVTVIIIAFSVLAFVGYGGAYVIYLWEEQQAVLKEQQEQQPGSATPKGTTASAPAPDKNESKPA